MFLIVFLKNRYKIGENRKKYVKTQTKKDFDK